MDAYTGAVQEEIKSFAGTSAVDTIYFGGGTPSLLGAGRLTAILETVTATFSVVPGAEVTVEVNPGDDLRCFFPRYPAWAGTAFRSVCSRRTRGNC